MARSPQLNFAGPEFAKMRAFGGALMRRAAYRRARPLSSRQALHLVLRSSQARGNWSLAAPDNRRMISHLLGEFARRYGIRVYQFGNAGNHLHLLIRITNRLGYCRFVRALSGAIALKVTGSGRNRALGKRFWDFRPFSRVVDFGPAYSVARDYVLLNRLEGLGVVPRVRARLRITPGELLDAMIGSTS